MARRIESLFLPGPAGRLEALLEEPEDESPQSAALVCHPHPQHGGTMHNKVVHRLAKALRRSGSVALRFNYRGVNLSEGVYDRGVGEVEDARSALSYLRARYPHLPYLLAGFSFGSRVILRLGCELPDAAQLIAVGFPANFDGSGELGRCDRPKLFVQSTNDQYGSRPAMEDYFAALPAPKILQWVEASDHFFTRGLDDFEEAVYQQARRSRTEYLEKR